MDRDIRASRRDGDSVAYLSGLLRVGGLTSEQIELAAELGDSAAAQLVPEVDRINWADYEAATLALVRAGELREDDTLHARIAIEAAERVLHVWEGRFPADTRPQEALAAARAWLECPCLEHTLEAGRCGNLLGHVFRTEAEVQMSFDEPEEYERVSAAGNAALKAAVAARTVGMGHGSGPTAGTRAAWAALDCAASAAEDPVAEGEWQRQRLVRLVLGDVGGPDGPA